MSNQQNKYSTTTIQPSQQFSFATPPQLFWIWVSLSYLFFFTNVRVHGQAYASPTKLLCEEIVKIPANFSVMQYLVQSGVSLDDCHCETLKRTQFLESNRAIITFYSTSSTSISEFHLKANSKDNNSIVERDYVTPMQIALAREDYALLRFLVDNGANLNYRCCDNLRPLEYALHTGKKDLADFLIRLGADVKQVEIGCLYNVDMARYFIQLGADPRTVRIDCALHDKKLAQALIELNPDFSGNQLNNLSFNDLATQPKLLEFLMINNFKTDGVNNNIEKRTLLSIAAELGELEVVKLLLNNNASINYADGIGLTPLVYAVMNNHNEVAQALIEAGAKVNVRIEGKQIETPLSLAYQQKNKMLFELLLQNGADIHIGAVDYLSDAVAANDTTLVRQLIAVGADATRLVSLYGSDFLFANPNVFELVLDLGAIPMQTNHTFAIQAVRNGNIKLANLFIERKTGLSSMDNDGKTALHYAFEQRDFALAYRLIEAGADVNVTIDGFEPFLHRAVRDNNLVMAHKLLQHQAAINAPNQQLETCLQIAILDKSYDMAKTLLRYGATIECEHLLLAIKLEHFSMVKLLVERGADLSCTSSGGQSLVRYARKHNLSYQITQYLKGQVE